MKLARALHLGGLLAAFVIAVTFTLRIMSGSEERLSVTTNFGVSLVQAGVVAYLVISIALLVCAIKTRRV